MRQPEPGRWCLGLEPGTTPAPLMCDFCGFFPLFPPTQVILRPGIGLLLSSRTSYIHKPCACRGSVTFIWLKCQGLPENVRPERGCVQHQHELPCQQPPARLPLCGTAVCFPLGPMETAHPCGHFFPPFLCILHSHHEQMVAFCICFTRGCPENRVL